MVEEGSRGGIEQQTKEIIAMMCVSEEEEDEDGLLVVQIRIIWVAVPAMWTPASRFPLGSLGN
jgi:hypothetical protein